jgi:hypothetical protein
MGTTQEYIAAGRSAVREIELTGTVPITATVDLDTGQVTEVHIWDEEATMDPGPEGDQDYARALEIWDEEPWPAWEFGA